MGPIQAIGGQPPHPPPMHGSQVDLSDMTDCMQSLTPRNVKLRELRVYTYTSIAMGANPWAPHMSMSVV